MANPLDSFQSAEFTNGFRVATMPKLSDMVQAHGLMPGLKMFDEELEKFRANLEKAINERLQPKAAPAPSKLTDTQ